MAYHSSPTPVLEGLLISCGPGLWKALENSQAVNVGVVLLLNRIFVLCKLFLGQLSEKLPGKVSFQNFPLRFQFRQYALTAMVTKWPGKSAISQKNVVSNFVKNRCMSKSFSALIQKFVLKIQSAKFTLPIFKNKTMVPSVYSHCLVNPSVTQREMIDVNFYVHTVEPDLVAT